MRLPLQEGWQGGPAYIEFVLDELQLDDGTVGPGVIIELHTPTDASGDVTTIELGTGKIEFPRGHGALEFWVAASLPQIKAIRDALSELLVAAASER